jgi:3'-5' exonuclease
MLRLLEGLMKLAFADIETDGLNPSKIHFVRVKTQDGFVNTFFDMSVFKLWVEFYQPDKWVFHNGIAFDVPVINRLVAPLINPRSVIDTFVVSKLVGYSKFITHSLEELGEYVGYKKIKYDGPWDVCTPEMIKYGEQDVEVLMEIFEYYKDYILDPAWAKAMRVEHDMAIICHDMSTNGFTFDKDTAETMLDGLNKEMETLEKSFQEAFPPKLVEVNRLKYRTKKDGSLFSTVEDAQGKYPLTKIEGEELICYDYQAFNPASSIDRIDALWEAKWKPVIKTKGFKKFEKESR